MIPIPNKLRIGRGGFSVYWFNLSFTSKEKESKFRVDYFNKSILTVRICIVTTAILYAGFGYFDIITSMDYLKEFFIVRFAVLEPFIFLLFLLTYHKRFRKIWQELMFIFFVIAGCGIIYMIVINPQNLLYHGGVHLVFMGGFFFTKLRFRAATTAGLVLIVIYTVAALLLQIDKVQILLAGAFFSSSVVIGSLALYNIELLERKEFFQKHLLQEKQMQIITQRDKIQIQKNQAVKQHNERITQHKEVEDSIQYAKTIQKAILPPFSLLDDWVPEHFVYYKPKDIVSGDFYWFKKIKHFLFFVVADCTGHGVPGAFMSMLGVSSLNETITTIRLDSTGEILHRLRSRVKSALHQKSVKAYSGDGMDMALFRIDTLTNELQYSGAYIPLIIIRNSELHEIKANKQPVAHYLEEKEFTTHNFKLKKGDAIYSYTDGYIDQFGGDKNKKLRGKKLKEILIEISDKPMDEQNRVLDERFESWKNGNYQVDDVLVMGIRV